MQVDGGSQQYVWVFVGLFGGFPSGGLPSGVFSNCRKASDWIERHGLTGTLTVYPVDIGTYEWAIEKRLFRPKKPHEFTAEFIGRFSSASQEHYHYQDGVCNGGVDASGLELHDLSLESLWVFVGVKAMFPTGFFTSRERAETWAASQRVSGTLISYPLDGGVIEWVIQQQGLDFDREHDYLGSFVETREHFKFEDGLRVATREEWTGIGKAGDETLPAS